MLVFGCGGEALFSLKPLRPRISPGLAPSGFGSSREAQQNSCPVFSRRGRRPLRIGGRPVDLTAKDRAALAIYLEHTDFVKKNGAGEGIRIIDPNLGNDRLPRI